MSVRTSLRAALRAVWLGVPLLGALGCVVPQAQYDRAVCQSRELAERNRAQLAELENLRVHARHIENQLMRTEQELALLGERAELERQQLAAYQRAHDEMVEQVRGLDAGQPAVSPVARRQLGELSRQFPDLKCDPKFGLAKLETDILFDTGRAELKSGAEPIIRRLVERLQSPEMADLRVVVVGHTDDRRIAGRDVRELYPTNFHLSAARALAVAEAMRQAGLPEHRIGLAAMGSHEPVAPNLSAADRQKNRRAEVFIMAPDVPVVGWTETLTRLY